MATTLRYPGVRPYETHERHLFFGRARDTADLYDLILLEKLLVLFGKSGYGKSSLIKAGIIPLFTEDAADRESEYVPMEIRFGSYLEGKSPAPLATTLAVLEKNIPINPEAAFLEPFFKGTSPLWHECKRRQGAAGGRYLLIFDQFEEYFTYPAEQQLEFRRQVAEALFETIPQHIRQKIDQLAPVQRDFLARPFDLKVVFSIRSDRLSLLDGMKDTLPGILHKRYELKAMDPKQARSAIVMPAGLPRFDLSPSPSPKGEGGSMAAQPSAQQAETHHQVSPFSKGEGRAKVAQSTAQPEDNRHQAPLPPGGGAGGEVFSTPSFTYSPDALQRILDNLTAGNTSGGVEAFQLQIVCQHLERQVQKGLIADRDGDGSPDIQTADLPDFNTVYEDYYNSKLAELEPAEARAARMVIEDGLLFVNEATGEARRLSKDPGELAQAFSQAGVTPALLDRLAKTYLLRREANSVGGFNYEISHDTLIAPIVKARELRRREEEKRRAARRRLRAAAILLGAALVTAGAIVFALWAFAQKKIADTEKNKANIALAAETVAKQTSDSLYVVADGARHVATDALAAAQKSEADALVARDQAEQNLQKFEAASIRIVNDLAFNAELRTLALDQDSAAQLLLKAATLNKRTPGFLKTLVDLAFFYNQANQADKAYLLLNAAGQKGFPTGNRTALRNWLARQWPADADSAQQRYYPRLVSIPGGNFRMGCLPERDGPCTEDAPAHPAAVAAFKMADSEVTCWQYGLFCRATGRNIRDKVVNAWGMTGNYPMMNVSWYEAAAYCNWASASLDRQPVYTLDAADRFVAINWSANGFRLPTETEWEFAAREGGSGNTAFSGSHTLETVGWFTSNSSNRTRPVKTKKPNRLGLYDMSGNVWEWCWDWHAAYPAEAPMHWSGPNAGDARVLRGGGWDDYAPDCRVFVRFRYTPDFRYNYYGFRVAQGGK